MAGKSCLLRRRERIFSKLQTILDFLKTTKDIEAATVRIKKVQTLNSDFDEIQEEIINYNCSVKEEDAIEVQQVDSSFLDLIYATELLYKQLSAGTSDRIPNEISSQVQVQNTSLPKLKIPPFSGNISDWQTFIELFNSSIHHTNLPDIVKFQHLRSLLQGEALHLVENFPLTSSNYSLAYSTLTNRFQNNRLLASFYINKLLSYKSTPLASKESLLSFISAHKDSIDAFNNLPIPDKADFLLFQITYSHLDKYLQTSFDNKFDPSEIPSFKDLVNHVEFCLKYKELHLTQELSTQDKNKFAKHQKPFKSHVSSLSPSTKASKTFCSLCGADHYITKCPEYKLKDPKERHELISSKKLCFNCLGPHLLAMCHNQKRCHICGSQHHTSLHVDDQIAISPAVSTHARYDSPKSKGSVLLATALVRLRAPSGQEVKARALLDQGSEISLISEAIVQQLSLRRENGSVPLKGIGAQLATTTRGMTSVKLLPHFPSAFSCEFNAYILPKLTANLPSIAVSQNFLSGYSTITLADPSFSKPGKIDLLIGADLYGRLLQAELIQAGGGLPTAQKTHLGWILSGTVNTDPNHVANRTFSTLQCSIDQELYTLVKRFWEQEQVQESSQKILTPDEQECELHFVRTHSRDKSGRYIVKLPFKKSTQLLGESQATAIKSLSRIHRKFITNQTFRDLYANFLAEYENLGHMVRSASKLHSQEKSYYLPHHGVLRESSSTTKLRVVFNGSSKTSSGVSLNEILHIGPKLQNNIADVIQWWRRFRYVFSTDIEKMFRQISVSPEDQTYQRILWSPDSTVTPQDYCLTTVTYGLACAPYLANRVLHQLAQDESDRFPLAVPVIKNGSYVDDLFGGADSIKEAQSIAIQLKELGMAGGFNLHKWSANHLEVISRFTETNSSPEVSFPDDSSTIRTLGIIWRPHSDTFVFESPVKLNNVQYTKRKILSCIAQIFDPLGWVTPVTIKAKIFLQKLWSTSLEWDEVLPEHLHKTWEEFIEQMQFISSLSVPRWIFCSNDNSDVEIHGFCDASQSAIAAVIYLKVIQNDGSVNVSILQAKSKVAPLKQMTIPRLELTAALLLVQQTAHVIKNLNLATAPVHLWTDSSVSLTWIQGHPSRWKEFISNRVSKIQELLPSAQWHHIPGKENPADCASRGLFPIQLKDHALWWNGPEWLHLPQICWPHETPNEILDLDLEERTKTVALLHHEKSIETWNLVTRFSKLNTLLRVTAICRRFISKGCPSLKSNPLSSKEIFRERLFWIQSTQKAFFPHQFKLLTQGKSLPRQDPLIKLNPFIDDSGILRVGGRLKNSLLDPEQKHPAILPRQSDFTTLIIREAHEKTLHGGAQLTLSYIRQSCWIIGGRTSIKSFILRCVRCARFRGKKAQQLMGQLPSTRTIPSRPFLHSGVDYAGPFSIKSWKGRGAKTYKGYIVIFVCFSTSAVHLDIVSDYTVEAFIAAYRRFTSRRGICATLSSDCGTNLVGANKELKRLFSQTSKEIQELSSLLANDGTEWKFNPPSAPHFGGKWEAGVKSVKYHLRRVIGDTLLTYEEYLTLLTQIEAVLNSRPLYPLSDDPEDLSALTPAHFLIGTNLATIPEPSLQDISVSGLSRWRQIQKLSQSFWHRWQREYLQRFLSNSKWTCSAQNLRPGNLVLVVDERYPPSKWPLGRISEVHPGPDGLVRVASIKTQLSTIKRPIVKLCPLPVQV